jgi:2'-5' RNA ligase
MNEQGSGGKAATLPSAPRPVARLFFALWPECASRERLSGWAATLHRSCRGRRIRDEQLHVTLIFLGDVPLDRVPTVVQSADRLTCPTFTLRFARPGYWAKKRLAWAAPEEVPGSLATLARELGSMLKEAGFSVEDRPYFPHATLLRDARCPDLPDRFEGFEWRVEDFVLVRSTLTPRSGSQYEVIGRWPLSRAD